MSMDLYEGMNIGTFYGHSHEHNSEGSKNITLTKVICMIFLGVSSFVSGNLPLLLSNLYDKKQFNSENERLQSKRRKRKVISVLLSFTGGVLFCVIFFHLLPEVREVFEELREDDYKDLPEFMPQALLCAGFIIMYFVEELAHKLMHSGKRSGRNTSDNQIAPYNPQLAVSYENYGKHNVVDGEKMSSFIKNVISITEEACRNLSFEDRERIISYVRDATNKQEIIASRPYDISTGNPIRHSPESGCHNSDIHELELVATNNDRSAVRSFLLALALSVHALFEGMAIGLEKRSVAVWLMLVGVGSHKILLSVCMGIEMVAGNIRKVVHISYVTMFAVLSPLGMGIGAIVSTEHDALSAIFQGIAAGTLLYVLFFEILKRNGGGNDDHNGVDSGFSSFFGIVIGFALMAALLSFADD